MSSNPSARPHIRFDVLDFYRYAGALFVALDHFVIIYLPVADWIKLRIEFLQPLMAFFFTLSGFVIMHVYDGRITSAQDYLDYLQKRLARIYPLHIVTLSIAVMGGLYVLQDPWLRTQALISNIVLLHAWNTTAPLSYNYPSWSVSAEIFVYLLFPVFAYGLARVRWLGGFILPVVSLAAISWFFQAFESRPWSHATYDFGCLRAVPSFLAGMAIYRLATVRFSKLMVPGWIAHGAAIATIPMMLAGVPDDWLVAMFGLVVFLLARAEPSTPGWFSSPTARALANCSYGFYMLHAIVGQAMLHTAPKYLHLDDAWTFALTPLAFVATTVLAVLSFRYFEDPARRYFGSFRLLQRQSVRT
jgi:peptidoglycan/LPS O-acetylase OafA/YrhL